MKRRFISFLIPFFCLMLLCGCVDPTNMFKRLSSQREILSLLSEQYGEAFTVISSERIEGSQIVRGKGWIIAPESDPELRFLVEECVSRSGGAPVPVIAYSYTVQEYYGDAVLYQALRGFLDENGIGYSALDAPDPIHYQFDGLETDATPSIVFAEKELEQKLPQLADFIAGLNDVHPFNRKGAVLRRDLFSIECKTQEGIVSFELASLQQRAGGELHLDAEELLGALTDDISVSQIRRQFLADFTAFCDEEGFEWQQPVQDVNTDLTLYFSSLEQVVDAEARLAGFISEYQNKETYLSPLCERLRTAVYIAIEQKGTGEHLASFFPFWFKGSAPPYLCLDLRY